jgi:hypothetical protein
MDPRNTNATSNNDVVRLHAKSEAWPNLYSNYDANYTPNLNTNQKGRVETTNRGTHW